MKLISEITSIVLVLYVFACLVDGFQMRRDRQILRGAVCVGFMALAGLVLGSVSGVLIMNQSPPSLVDPITWASYAVPFLGLLASVFVTSQRTVAILVAGSAIVTAVMLALFLPINLMQLKIPQLNYLVPVVTPLIIMGAFLAAKSRWLLANIHLIASFVCANYIIATVLGYMANKLVGMPKGPDFSPPLLPTVAVYAAAIAAWFVAQAIVQRFQRQTSSVTSEA